MKGPELIPINFTISVAAKREIENLRQFWNAEASDPAAVALIAWGLFRGSSGEEWENVVVTFYGKSQRAEVEHRIQIVSGLPVVFFTTAAYHPNFEGKVVDHAAEQGFFLRDSAASPT